MSLPTPTKTAIFTLALATILLTGFALQADPLSAISGQITVKNVAPQIRSASFTSTVTPGDEYILTIQIRDDNTIRDIDSLTIILWDTAITTLNAADNITSHYTLVWTESSSQWTYPLGSQYFSNLPSVSSSQKHANTMTFTITVTTSVVAAASSGKSWSLQITVIDDQDASDTENLTFDVNPYLAITANDLVFVFEAANPGTINVPITDPTNGALSFTVTANHAYQLRIRSSGLYLTSDSDTIGISNVSHAATDNTKEAIALTTEWTTLGGSGIHVRSVTESGDSDNALYLWINIPDATPVGIYTFAISVEPALAGL